MISIIIPCYNVEQYIKPLLEELKRQVQNEEVIVVDDCSTDNTREILKDYEDIFKIIYLDTNSNSASKPRNIGMDNAKGDYLTFIDADDMIYSNYLESIRRIIKENEFDKCFFNYKSINHDSNVVGDPPAYDAIVWNGIYKKTNIRFNESMRVGEDKDFNERYEGKKIYVEDLLYHHTYNPNSLSHTN